MAEGVKRTRMEALAMGVRAAPLFGRPVAGGDCPADARAAVEGRLARWRQTAAAGDDAAFERRLAKDGLDVASAEALLATSCTDPGDGAQVPDWAEALSAAASVRPTGPELSEVLVPARPLPFEDILLPLVSSASARVADRLSEAWDGLSGEAADAFRRQLLARLTSLAAPSLFLEFSIFRQQRESAFGRLLRIGAGSAPTELYRAFAGQMSAGGLAAFWKAYPVLARLVGTVWLQWIDATARFLSDLRADRGRIATSFHGGVDPGGVESLQAGVSDVHRGGLSAVVVRFSSGRRVVYKPHVLGMEVRWFELLGWLNAHGAPLALRTLGVIDRGDHGWVEFAERQPCADEAEAADYFRRAGMLACLAYALGASDLHLENVVACGDQPVIVDLEMVLQPRRADGDLGLSRAESTVRQWLGDSVLSTGLLPAWVDVPGGNAINLGGLDGAFEATRQLAWQGINTDGMQREFVEAQGSANENQVTVAGRSVSTESYAGEMVEGFGTMYGFIQEHSEGLLAAGGPIERFAGQQVRFVVRPTMIYGRILNYLIEPQFLRDGLDRSIEMDALARPLAVGEAPEPVWPLYRAERRALERADVPYFHLMADGDVLSGEGERVEGFVELSPLARARARIEAMDASDLRQQAGLVRLSLSAASLADTPGPVGQAAEEGTPPAPDALIDFARTVGGVLAEAAVRGEDGSAAWMGWVTDDERGHGYMQCLDRSLYGGAPGVAVFLAALDHVAGGGFGELARAALEPVRVLLSKHLRLVAQMSDIGAAGGLGALIYSLTRVGVHLRDERLLHDAGRAAALVTPARIEADRVFDVIGGSAGAILSLLALHDVTPDDGLLASAAACGRRLLAGRIETPCGARAWKAMPDFSPLAGFAHGVAGIAYALLRLFERTGDAAFRDAAVEAIAYERTLFVPDAGNWLDLREKTESRAAMSAWCHGATGVGLARIGGLAVLDTPEVRSDVEVALRTTLAQGATPPYRLCCGLSGRLELLVTGGQTLGRPELRTRAASLLGSVIAQADRSGPEALVARGCIGLFQGLAGVGYACLRVGAPERVAPLLLWRA